MKARWTYWAKREAVWVRIFVSGTLKEALLKHKEKEFSLLVLRLGQDVQMQECAPRHPMAALTSGLAAGLPVYRSWGRKALNGLNIPARAFVICIERHNAGDWEHLRHLRGRCNFLTHGPVSGAPETSWRKLLLPVFSEHLSWAPIWDPHPSSGLQGKCGKGMSWRWVCSQHSPVQRYYWGGNCLRQ